MKIAIFRRRARTAAFGSERTNGRENARTIYSEVTKTNELMGRRRGSSAAGSAARRAIPPVIISCFQLVGLAPRARLIRAPSIRLRELIPPGARLIPRDYVTPQCLSAGPPKLRQRGRAEGRGIRSSRFSKFLAAFPSPSAGFLSIQSTRVSCRRLFAPSEF